MSVTDRLTGFEASIAVKAPCYVASTGVLTLSATQTIDGISVSTGQRVLVKDQASAVDNGIYVCQSSSWARAKDFDGARDAKPGTLVYVDRGTQHGQTFWVSNSSSTSLSIAIGTDSVTFSDVSLALSNVSAFSQSALANSSASGWRSTLGLVPGTDVQAFNQALADISGLIPSTGGMFYYSSTGEIVQLSIGTAGQVVQASTDSKPIWVSPSVSGSSAATQAQMEAENSTATFVTPSIVRHNPGVAKFWVKFNGTSSDPVTPDADYNVVDVSDNGTGDYTVNVDTDFSSSHWAAFAWGSAAEMHFSIQLAGTVRILARGSGGGAIDSTTVFASGFGDHA